MSFKQDWMERQIEAMGKTLVAVIFGKEKLKNLALESEERFSQNEMEEEILEHILEEYLKNGEICKAEDMLFESIKENKTPKKMIIGLKFYSQLDNLDQEFLKKNNFSKEEIIEGVKELSVLANT